MQVDAVAVAITKYLHLDVMCLFNVLLNKHLQKKRMEADSQFKADDLLPVGGVTTLQELHAGSVLAGIPLKPPRNVFCFGQAVVNCPGRTTTSMVYQ